LVWDSMARIGTFTVTIKKKFLTERGVNPRIHAS